MCDNESQSQHARNHNANRTGAIVATINALKKFNFERMMGSGLNISITKLDGVEVCPEFVLPAEDMEKVKMPIIASLVEMLMRRQIMLRTEISDIEKAIAAPATA